jgi:hypothetical protein
VSSNLTVSANRSSEYVRYFMLPETCVAGFFAFLSKADAPKRVSAASLRSRSRWRARRQEKRENSSGKGSIRSTPGRTARRAAAAARAASKDVR